MSLDEALHDYKEMKKCLQGLFEVLRINFEDSDIYFQIGLDNIGALYKHFIKLLLNEKGIKEFSRKLNRSELDLDFSLSALSKKTEK